MLAVQGRTEPSGRRKMPTMNTQTKATNHNGVVHDPKKRSRVTVTDRPRPLRKSSVERRRGDGPRSTMLFARRSDTMVCKEREEDKQNDLKCELKAKNVPRNWNVL